MAGKRQHFIPQFLQKGFASHTDGDEAFTWVYRKGQKPFNSNIKNVGVEGLFYSEKDDPSLDDVITSAEGDFAQLIDSLRQNDAVDEKDYVKIAHLFAHLEIRTRHLRQSFFTTGNLLINEFLEYLSDPSSCKNFIRRMLKNDPSIIKTTLYEELNKLGLPQELLPELIKLSDPFIELSMPNMPSLLTYMAAYLKVEMPAILKKATKTGHIKALNRGLAPDVKVQLFENLNYRIENSESDLLILGDSPVVFHVSGDRGFKTFLEKGDDLIAVLLPITHRQLLVGSKERYVPIFSTLRRKIACCSLEYFIAGEANPENGHLSEDISKNAHLLNKSEIEEILNDFINEKSSDKANPADVKSRTAD